jgi:phosphatidate phosphatase APP1
MPNKIPILLSFYALTSEKETLINGQLTYTSIDDLTFKAYSRRKTFRTLFRLYHTKPYANQEITLHFSKVNIQVTSDSYGSFSVKTNPPLIGNALHQVTLGNGKEVKIISDLYPIDVQQVHSDVIVVSDIDDTLMHSFIYQTILKFKTLMFTAVEKRKPVEGMQEMLTKLTHLGASSFYVSNSEQNLYPLIYRFLIHNKFPNGPIFLKKLRSLWKVILNIKFPLRNIHKDETLAELLDLFPEKKFVLIGDNTQHDLAIYLNAAEKYRQNIRYIIIRKVVEKRNDDLVIAKAKEALKNSITEIFYAKELSVDFSFGTNQPSS